MNWMTGYSIGRRLAGAFAALLVLLGLVMGFALVQTDRMGESSRDLASSSLRNVMLAREAQAAAQAGAAQLQSLFLLDERAQRVPVYARIDRNTAKRDAAISALLASARAADATEALAHAEKTRTTFERWFYATVEGVEMDPAAARDMMLARTMPALDAMLVALDELVQVQSSHAALTVARIEILQRDSRRAILGVGLVAILLAFASAVAITRSITHPLSKAVTVASDIASGNLAGELPPGGRDEVGSLMTALAAMRTGISAREQRISDLAFRDSLTRLPNRTSFDRALSAAVDQAHADGSQFAVMVLDLDRFRQVNEVLGHSVGDRVLRQVADRLQPLLPPREGLLARTGGDEFALLLLDCTRDRALALSNGLLAILEAPTEIDGQLIDVGGSIGVVLYPEHGRDASQLLARADVAMYVAKEAGGGLQTFDLAFERNADHGLSLLSDLRHALEAAQFELRFQPRVTLADGVCRSVEVLIRWEHPERGTIAPDRFIPFAEKTGLIRRITAWVLDAACEQAARWRGDGLAVSVSVNMSARDLSQQELPGMIVDILRRHDLPPGELCLEITESAVMEEPTQALAVLQRLNDLGVVLSIDDFGTGYSSLAYLRKLPVRELKIDRSFVRNLDTDAGDEVIVRSTVELAHNLGLRVVAEGVESAAALEQLVLLGCDEVQGYFLGKPMSAQAFRHWYTAQERPQRAPSSAGTSGAMPGQDRALARRGAVERSIENRSPTQSRWA